MKKIGIISGEISGDRYAGLLGLELKKLAPGLEIVGTGGRHVKESGIRIICEYPSSGAFGFTEILFKISGYLKFLNKAALILKQEKPDLLVFIDNPGFNLKLASMLPGIPKIYYIPPKIWAHHAGRIKEIKKNFSAVISIFPFETEIYRKAGIPSCFFGHPAADLLENDGSGGKEFGEFLAGPGVPDVEKTVGLFPGSRKSEILHILPVLLRTAKDLAEILPGVRFIVSAASPEIKKHIEAVMKKNSFSFPVWDGQSKYLAVHSDLCLAASGTMNIEIALLGRPMVVFYRMDPVNYTLGSFMVKLPYINPVNILLGEKAVEEFIQRMPGERIRDVCLSLLRDGEIRHAQEEKFRKLKLVAGVPGVSLRAAEFIINGYPAYKWTLNAERIP